MSGQVTLDALYLAALLCSRVCHDLISPTGAIVNGLEVLEEKDSDEETRTIALDLIKRSAKTASVRLQFCRLAFGAAGSPTAQIDLGNAQAMARAFIEGEKTKLAWNLPAALLPKDWPGRAARKLCGDIYRALLPASEQWLDQHAINENGPLPAPGRALARRFRD